MDQQTQGGAPTSSSSKKNKGGMMLLIAAVVIIVGLVIFFGPQVSSRSQGAVVALVDGQKIYQGDIDERFALVEGALSQSGQEVDTDAIRTQILDDLIGEELLFTDAQEKGIVANEEEIDSEYAIAEQALGEGGLEARMEELGLSESDIRDDIRKQIVLRKYVDQELLTKATPTEEQLLEVYNAGIEQLPEGEEVPVFEDVQEEIQAGLLNQNLTVMIGDLISQLKAAATIEIK